MTSRIEYNNPAGNNKLGLSYHYEMISDSLRVTPFKMAILKACPQKRVLESGAGSGILSIIAAKAGAAHVYATEIDSNVAKFAQHNIDKNGLAEKITIIKKDTKKLTLKDIGGEKVDVAIAENLSTWEVNEPQISVMNHINKSLIKENGIRIPEMIYNSIELAYSQFSFEDAIELRTYFFQFTGIVAPKILSDKMVFSKIDLAIINPVSVDASIEIPASQDGVVNSIRLTSPLKVLGDITFGQSDSLMPPVVFPLSSDKKVKKGDMVKVHISYKYHTDWSAFGVKVTN